MIDGYRAEQSDQLDTKSLKIKTCLAKEQENLSLARLVNLV